MPAMAAPFLWYAAVEAAKATAFIVGVVATAIVVDEAVEQIDEALDEREKAKTSDTAADKTCVNNCGDKKCPPCAPPAGTIRVKRIDRVPPGKKHHPCPGDHAHLIQMNQRPHPDCGCFWNKARPDVYCLGPGEMPPYPMS